MTDGSFEMKYARCIVGHIVKSVTDMAQELGGSQRWVTPLVTAKRGMQQTHTLYGAKPHWRCSQWLAL